MTVLGMPDTSYRVLTLLCVSNSIGKETGVALRKVIASPDFGSTLMPSSVKPAGLYLRYICSRIGISCRQGPHQLAQKLISTTWPLRSARLTGLPAAAGNLNAAAGEPVLAAGAGSAAAGARARPRVRTQTVTVPAFMTVSIQCDRAPAAQAR